MAGQKDLKFSQNLSCAIAGEKHTKLQESVTFTQTKREFRLENYWLLSDVQDQQLSPYQKAIRKQESNEENIEKLTKALAEQGTKLETLSKGVESLASDAEASNDVQDFCKLLWLFRILSRLYSQKLDSHAVQQMIDWNLSPSIALEMNFVQISPFINSHPKALTIWEFAYDHSCKERSHLRCAHHSEIMRSLGLITRNRLKYRGPLWLSPSFHDWLKHWSCLVVQSLASQPQGW